MLPVSYVLHVALANASAGVCLLLLKLACQESLPPDKERDGAEVELKVVDSFWPVRKVFKHS